MTEFAFAIDRHNPSHAIGALGLFALAAHLYPTTECYFLFDEFLCVIRTPDAHSDIYAVLNHLSATHCSKTNDDEVYFGEPFHISVNWWKDPNCADLKTWAGRQDVHMIVLAEQSALRTFLSDHCDISHMFFYHTPLLKPGKNTKYIAPLYLDAYLSRIHSRDVGFSLDKHNIRLESSPATELLCLIGLNFFRPQSTERYNRYRYSLWAQPLPLHIAKAAFSACHDIPLRSFTFSIQNRDDKGRYKTFSYAIEN